MKLSFQTVTKMAVVALACAAFLSITGPSIAGSGGVVSSQRSGATVYSQSCARCHGADGRAQTAKGRQVKAVDLTSSDWEPDTARDIRIVTKGKDSMPAFKGRLNAAEISSVVEYIRRFKN